jgi:putative NADH-flavin reductase
MQVSSQSHTAQSPIASQSTARLQKTEIPQNIVIFGATGSVGRELVKQALTQGHTVTAFVRDPAKVTGQHGNMKLVQGDVLDAAAVERAVLGQDAVFCVLGAGMKGTIRAEGTRHIIAAMEKTGVRRLICQSTLGVGDSRNNLNAYWKYVMFGMLLRRAYADHVKQEKLVRQSQLEWTIIRPAAFTDGEHTGQYRHGFASHDKSISLTVARADVADFLLSQLTDTRYLYQSPGLSY